MKIGLLFPGYDSQFVGMGKDIYDDSRLMQEYFEEASNCMNMNFVKLCFASSDVELSKLQNAYLSLFLVSVATAALIKEAGIKIDKVGGFGIGEFSAIATANGLSFPDGLYILSKLASLTTEFLQRSEIKSTKIKGMSSKKIKDICQELSKENLFVQIVSVNIEDEVVVTGTIQAVDKLIATIKNKNIFIEKKTIETSANCDLFLETLNQFIIYFEKIDFKDLQCPVISCVDGKEITSAKDVKKYIIKNLTKPHMLNKMLSHFEDCDVIIVPTPGIEISKTITNLFPGKKIITIAHVADIDMIKTALN